MLPLGEDHTHYIGFLTLNMHLKLVAWAYKLEIVLHGDKALASWVSRDRNMHGAKIRWEIYVRARWLRLSFLYCRTLEPDHCAQPICKAATLHDYAGCPRLSFWTRSPGKHRGMHSLQHLHMDSGFGCLYGTSSFATAPG